MRSIEILDEIAEQKILELLVEDKVLEGPALGIARQVLSRGRESLTERQEHVFQRFVVDQYINPLCRRCQSRLTTSEALNALMEADDLCGWCSHMRDKYY